MDLKILETYAQARVNVYKMEQKLIEKEAEINRLKEQLKQSKNAEELSKYFTTYDEDIIFINESTKQELLNFIIGENND